MTRAFYRINELRAIIDRAYSRMHDGTSGNFLRSRV